jgi:hypothetical protein
MSIRIHPTIQYHNGCYVVFLHNIIYDDISIGETLRYVEYHF